VKYNPDVHRRRSIRLRGYDYSQAGAYFVTICVQGRVCLLGDVVDGQMQLNEAGRIAQYVWNELPQRFPGIALDQYAIMPNHVHGIIVLVGAQFIAPNDALINQGVINQGVINQGVINQGVINHAPTLGEIVRTFKAVTTRRIRLLRVSYFAWQRNYYEHIIRNDGELNRAREYIVSNPSGWQLDQLHPDNPLETTASRP